MIKLKPNNIQLQTEHSVGAKKEGDNVSNDRFSMIMSMYNEKSRKNVIGLEDTIDAHKNKLGQNGEGTLNSSCNDFNENYQLGSLM